MGKNNQTNDVGPLISRLVDAGINPVILEAFCRMELPEDDLSPQFIKTAVDALDAASRCLGVVFDLLFRESKIALLDFVLAIGVDTFSRLMMMGPAVKDEGALLKSLGQGALTLPGKDGAERTGRIIESMARDRLVFKEQEINQLREGDLRLGMGSRGPAVRYVQKLLQISRRILEPKQKTWFPRESKFGSNTSDALKTFQTSMKRSATGVLDWDTLALLEIGPIDKASKGALLGSAPPSPDKDSAWAGLIDNKKFWVNLGYADFDAFMAFYMQLQVDGSQVGVDDLKSLKYILGPIQKENEETFAQTRVRLEGYKKKSSIFARRLWSGSFLGKTAFLPFAVGGGYLVYSMGSRLKNGTATMWDEKALDVTNSLLEKASYKSPLSRAGGLPTRSNEVQFQAGMKSSDKLFTNPSANAFKGLGVGVAVSGEWFNHRRIDPKAGKTALMANGFDDGCLWFCAMTCAHYTTYELRDLLLRQRLSPDLLVKDVHSKEQKLVRIGDIPGVGASLYSKTDRMSAKLGGSMNQIWEPTSGSNLYRWGAESRFSVEPASLSLNASGTQAVAEDPSQPHEYIRGLVTELGGELRCKFPLGPNTSTRTNTLDASVKVNGSRRDFPLDSLDSRKLVTAAGLEWNAVHQDEYSMKMALSGSYTLNETHPTGAPSVAEARFKLQSTGRRFTVTADASWKLGSTEVDWSWTVRFVYHFH